MIAGLPLAAWVLLVVAAGLGPVITWRFYRAHRAGARRGGASRER